MKNIDKLTANGYFHIFNRAVGDENMFIDDFDYSMFTQKWQKYIQPVSHCYAFCLMPNHFHFLVRMKEVDNPCSTEDEDAYPLYLKGFRAFFTSYAKYFNIRHKRKGKLFMLPYRRIEVRSDAYLTQLIYYIHRNPIHHNYVSRPDDWEHSSYRFLTGERPTWIRRDYVLSWFGGKERFIEFHKTLFTIRPEFDVLHRSM